MTPVADGKLISIITVCYEDRANVEKTCASIAAQTASRNVEHILVDGSSSDGTQAWYAENPPLATSTLISEPDRGIFHAMNKGADLAQGRYLCFLNAGDVWGDPQYLTRLEDTLNEHKPRWFYSRARVVNADGQDVRGVVGVVPYSRTRHLLGFATICHQTVVMNRELFRTLSGFNESFSYAADYHLLLKAGALSEPLTSSSIDVLYAAGGVSDVDVYKQLWRRHAARVDAMAMSDVFKQLDRLWTYGQVSIVRARKLCKRLLRKVGVSKFLGKVVS